MIRAAVGIALAASMAVTAAAPGRWPTYYDASIQRASSRWLPWDWRWLKAELIAESGLNPHAVSPVGARGLAQLMPATHAEIATALRAGMASPDDADYAIEAGAFYLSRQRALWTAKRTEDERRQLAQASYNAGAGNIQAAQRRCTQGPGPCQSWTSIAPHLPAVTGTTNAAETTGYVARIDRLFRELSQ